MPCPNVATNDVYYRRQLSLYTFNIHNLGTNDVFLYTYDESTGKKGSDDVCSMLYDFFTTKLSADVQRIDLFCDNCAGQNKNYTMLRFVYALVHFIKRFQSISMHFPLRGHSYMECDKDMAVINQKTPCEVPKDWYKVFKEARQNPTPYHVEEVQQHQFKAISEGLHPFFENSCPISTRSIRELKVEMGFSNALMYRDNWNGQYEVTGMLKKRRKKTAPPVPVNLTFKMAYKHRLPIATAKFKDLQHLKKFCKVENQDLFDAIPQHKKVAAVPEPVHDEIDDFGREAQVGGTHGQNRRHFELVFFSVRVGFLII